MMIQRTALAVIAAFVILSPRHGNAAENVPSPLPSPAGTPQRKSPKATLNAEQLKMLLREYGKITSLSIEYSATKRPEGASVDSNMQSTVRREIVAQAPCFMYHDSSHETNSVDWRDDPYRQVAYFDRSYLVVAHMLNRAFFQRPYKADLPLDGTLATEFFFVSTGIWPLSSRSPPRPNNRPHVLTEVAESTEYNGVRDRLDHTAGVWCHVLFSKDQDYLWIDSTYGARLVQREIYSPQNGALMSRYTLTAHKEIGAGLWCPTLIRSEQFNFGADTPAQQRRRVADSEVVLSKVSTSIKDESEFTFHPAPGWLQLDAEDIKAAPVQVVPGGEIYLDDLSAWIKRCRVRPVEPVDTAPVTKARYMVTAGILLICVAVLEALLWRKCAILSQ